MGGGNGQKAKMAREKNLEKSKAAGKGKISSLLLSQTLILQLHKIKNYFWTFVFKIGF